MVRKVDRYALVRASRPAVPWTSLRCCLVRLLLLRDLSRDDDRLRRRSRIAGFHRVVLIVILSTAAAAILRRPPLRLRATTLPPAHRRTQDAL
jgi:hypothetical protein